MRSFIKVSIILGFFCLLIPGKIQAQEISLGSFSLAEIEKLTQDVNLKIGEISYVLPKAEIKDWIKEETFLIVTPEYFSEIENQDICQYEKSLICAISFGYKNKNHIGKKSDLVIKREAVSEYVKSLSERTSILPDEARFKIEDGKVTTFSLGKNGMKLEEEKSIEIIMNYLKDRSADNNLKLPYLEVKPENQKIDSIDDLGINTLLGEGHSNFKGSPKNRVYNIKVALKRFEGILIKPGEEFSFVKTLGEVDGEHGYLPELVIKKDKTEPEFGGGICQVSTTAFRAAIYSGLEITARRNHAYPVQYYNPQGMDATVYIPKPDLRFKNDTPGHILIQTKIEGTELIFSFYGTNDGRKVNVIGPTIYEKNSDGSMKTTFTQQIMDKEGNLIREDIFKSNYDSPNKYPHPTVEANLLTKKPKNWSEREWKQYKKDHNIN